METPAYSLDLPGNAKLDIYYSNVEGIQTVSNVPPRIILDQIANQTAFALSTLVNFSISDDPTNKFTIRFERKDTAALVDSPLTIDKDIIYINSGILERSIANPSHIMQLIIASMYKQANPLWRDLQGEGRIATQTVSIVKMVEKPKQTNTLVRPFQLATTDDFIRLGNNMSFLVSIIGLLVMNRNTTYNIPIYSTLLRDQTMMLPNHKLYYAANSFKFLRAKAGALIPGCEEPDGFEMYKDAFTYYFRLANIDSIIKMLNDQLDKVQKYLVAKGDLHRDDIQKVIDQLGSKRRRGNIRRNLREP